MKEPDDRSRRCFLKASSMSGLAVALRPATIGEAFAQSQSTTAQKENSMPQTKRPKPVLHSQPTRRLIVRFR